MNRRPKGLSHLIGILSLSGSVAWITGCGRGTVPPASGAAGIAARIDSDPAPPVSGVVFKEKADLEAFAASLKLEGVDLADTKGVDLRTFGFSGMSDILEVSVEVEKSPRPAGEQWPRKFVLSPDDPAERGTINVAILPPSATGKEGVKIILQIQSQTETGMGKNNRTKTLICDLPALWFATPNRRAMSQSGLDFGSKLKIKRGRGLRMIGYMARRGSDSYDFQVDFRCAGKAPGK